MNTILNSLFYVSGYEFGSECFLGVFSNNINEVIEEDMKEHPARLRSCNQIIPVEVNKTRMYREWEWGKNSKNLLTKPN